MPGTFFRKSAWEALIRYGEVSLRLSGIFYLVVAVGCVNTSDVRLDPHQLARLRSIPNIRVVHYKSGNFRSVERDGKSVQENLLDSVVNAALQDAVTIDVPSPILLVKDRFVAQVSEQLKPVLLEMDSKPIDMSGVDPLSQDRVRLVFGFRPAFVFQDRAWGMWNARYEREQQTYGALIFEVRATLVLPEDDEILWQRTCRVETSSVKTGASGEYELHHREQFRALQTLMEQNKQVLQQIAEEVATTCAKDLVKSFSGQ